jgi:hypothetical protein
MRGYRSVWVTKWTERGRGVASAGGEGVDAAFEFGLGFRVVTVAGAGSDEVGEFEAFGGERLGDGLGGLDLAVVFAAVGDGGDHAQVGGVFGGVVEAPEFLFPPGGLERFALEDAQEFGRFAEAGAGGGGGPAPGVVDGEMPARRPAEREAADDEAVVVDGKTAGEIGERLPGVGFAGEPRAVAIPAVGMEDQGVGGRELARASGSIGEERQFAQFLAAAVEPEVDPVPVGAGGFVGGGDHDAVGLHRTVDVGDVAERHGSRPGEPGGAAFAEGGGAFEAFPELNLGGPHFVGGVEFVVTERPVDRLVEDPEVGEAGEEGGFAGQIATELVDLRAEPGHAGRKAAAVVLGNRDTGRRHGTNLVGEVVRRTVGAGTRGGKGEDAKQEAGVVEGGSRGEGEGEHVGGTTGRSTAGHGRGGKHKEPRCAIRRRGSQKHRKHRRSS